MQFCRADFCSGKAKLAENTAVLSRASTQHGLKAAVKTDACSTLVSLNIFAGTEHDSANYGKVQESFRKHTAETANKGRAPPMGGVKYSLEPYSNQQIENWKSSKRINVYENSAQLDLFVKRAIEDKGFTGKMFFGVVGNDLANAIETATGYNFTGRNVTLRADHVRKIFKDHGSIKSETARGQRAITANDFTLIPDVISEPEKIKKSTYNNRPAAEFIKVIDGSRVTVIAVDSGGSLDLYVQTMYASAKKGSIARMVNANALTKTPETTTGTAPNTNISNTSKNVNEKFSLEPVSDSAYMEAVERGDIEKALRGWLMKQLKKPGTQ